MPRFNRFYSSESLANRQAGERVEVRGDEGSHLARVLRLRPGDEVELFDQHAGWKGELESVGKSDAVVRLSHSFAGIQPPALALTMLIAPMKGDFDDLVVRLAELGVERTIPLTTRYSEVDFAKRDPGKIAERFEKLAIRAAKQCGINRLIQVSEQMPLAEAFKQCEGSSLKCFCDLSDTAQPLREFESPTNVACAVGPEGGWSDQEREALLQSGYQPVALPGGVLRSATACLSAASILLSSKLE